MNLNHIQGDEMKTKPKSEKVALFTKIEVISRLESQTLISNQNAYKLRARVI